MDSITLTNDANRTAPYQARPPSPPYIHIPAYVVSDKHMSIVPHFSQVDSGALTESDLEIITQGKAQIAKDTTGHWRYEERRRAQPILDFLYLGPSSVTRDPNFLAKEGITMILACRDARFPAGFLSIEKAASELDIVTDTVDVTGKPDLVRAFPEAVRKINNHLLDVYRRQAVQVVGGEVEQQVPVGQMVIDLKSFKRGKVLVCCETGNDRSAVVVAAYIMTVFGVNLVSALQFVALQRFCAAFDDESKYFLQSYEDLLKAKRDVIKQLRLSNTSSQQPEPTTGLFNRGPSQTKRRIEETLQSESTDTDDMVMDEAEEERYMGREFAPFIEHDI